jgi:spore coat protein U-like protein
LKRACIVILFVLLSPAALAQGGQNITCTASNITLSFGAFDVLAGTTLDAAGSFTVTCVSSAAQNRNVTYTARLAVTPARQMAPPAGADRLTYEVYVDSSRTQPWGDGTGGTFTITNTFLVPRKSSASDAPRNFYARITPGGQDVSAASPPPPPTTYSQTLNVTVTCTPSPPC